jgi:hypothetical protein
MNKTSAIARTPVLSRPTGPYPIGVVDLHLVDGSRPDPWNPPQAYRELMVGVVCPAPPERRPTLISPRWRSTG